MFVSPRLFMSVYTRVLASMLGSGLELRRAYTARCNRAQENVAQESVRFFQ